MDTKQAQNKEKIAVIGGGVGSMAAVFALTDTPNWSENYEIDVYQMGWRLGGKGASGRNQDFSQRIEEHGLHIWFGCYHNAIAVMRKTYEELARDKSHPLASWDDAFKPHSLIGLAENIGSKWGAWYIDYPRLPGVPGEGTHNLSVRETLLATLRYLEHSLFELAGLKDTKVESHLGGVSNQVGVATRFISRKLPKFFPDFETIIFNLHDLVTKIVSKGDPVSPLLLKYLKNILINLKSKVISRLYDYLEEKKEFRRLFISIDLSTAIILGIIEDGVLTEGFDVINDEDFKRWLCRHGADEKYSVNSGFIRSLYDLVFAYENGDYSKPNLEAGTMLRAILRMTECYNDAFMFKMQGGMGDIVFEPFYKLLKKRGVNFHFFSEILDVVPFDNKIGEILIRDQLILNQEYQEYDPLVEINGSDCWPSKPLILQFSQDFHNFINQNSALMEHDPSQWAERYKANFNNELPVRKLVCGVDFDTVIFGASLASLPIIGEKLIAADPDIRAMVDNVKTNATQAFQIWNKSSLQELGWIENFKEEPVLSGFIKPFDTWAPMGHLIDIECWGEIQPQSLFYHCNVFPKEDELKQSQSDALAKDNAVKFLQEDMHKILPSFDFYNEKYSDETFYWRTNQYGSERYVVSHVGTSKYRLKTNGSKFSNLYFVGDWIDNSINVGCVEAAVMSGMMASREICGSPLEIIGESDF